MSTAISKYHNGPAEIPEVEHSPSTSSSSSTLMSPSTTTFLLLLLLTFQIRATEEEAEEEFSESLLLRPLPDRKLLSNFHFRTSTLNHSHHHHHHLFPKSISLLIRKFHIKEMELSFTHGRWDYHLWGAADSIPLSNAKPPGVELSTLFHDSLPSHLVDSTWKALTHALSGLFCSSINFLDSPTSFISADSTANLRYGALPREAVCTENLTPWLKLLPCRDKSGVASLLHRPSIYSSSYHSQRLRLTSTDLLLLLDQTLTVVLRPPLHSPLHPNWSIRSLFGRNMIGGRCVVASSTRVFVELDKSLPSPSFHLSRPSDDLYDRGGSVLHAFSANADEDLDIGLSWNLPYVWSPSPAPLQASRFLMGSGNERGSIAIRLLPEQRTPSPELDSKCSSLLDVSILQIVPWYVKIYYHTLKVFVDGGAREISDVVTKLQVSPSEDKMSPGVMELMLKLPCSMNSTVLTIDFDKGFLHIDEYPPDANQGFDIPAAIVSYPNFTIGRDFFEETRPSRKHYSLESFKERSPIRTYTEILLVPLTTPDFSMPYNVITFTCTVLALYFGSLLNVLRRRVREEERFLNKAAATGARQGLLPQLLSKITSKLWREAPQSSSPSSSPQSLLGYKQLLKVFLVAATAILWYYFQNDR